MTIASRWIMHMRWFSLLFMHWRVPVAVVRPMRPTIPTALTIDTFDGHAWVGLIPFTMRLPGSGLLTRRVLRRAEGSPDPGPVDN
jgi:uncharacterized protein YqjF (DUF2071 family)